MSQFTFKGREIYRESHNHDSRGDHMANVPEGMTVDEAKKRLATIGSLSGKPLEEKRRIVIEALSKVG